MRISKLLVLGTVVVALSVATPLTADIKYHGIAIQKVQFGPGGDVFAQEGDTVDVHIRVTNIDDYGHAVRINGIYDVVHHTSGDVASGNLLAAPFTLTNRNDYHDVTYQYVVAVGDPNPLIDTANTTGTDLGTGLTVTASVESPLNLYAPEIGLDKYADKEAFCEGGTPTVNYTYEVTNTGDEDLTDVEVYDDLGDGTCYPTGPSGDDGDGYLNPDETWTYTCVKTISDTYYNEAEVQASGRYTDAFVNAFDDWTVTATPPPGVDVNPESAEICEGGDPVELCAVVTGGIGNIVYSWTKDGSPMVGETGDCITVSEAGKYCVHIVDETTKCDAEACGTLVVNENPSCILEAAAAPVCPSEGGNYVLAAVTGGTPKYTLVWEITAGAGWAIESGQGTDELVYSVSDVADECATFKLTVTDSKGCETTCDIEVCCTGDTYCTFTQGFYGNAGGTACGGMTTTQIIDAVLGSGVRVGIEGQRSILFTSAADIILRLPAGGTPRVLPAGLNVNANNTAALKDAKLLKGKDDRITNTLVGQVVALTLNMRLHTIPCMDADGFDQALADYVFPEADYICVQQGEDGCIMRYAIPESLQGLSVDALLAKANLALAGDEKLVDGAYEGASFVNELFDECMTIVACPVDPVEICDDECDNDFDGVIDENVEEGDCIILPE